MNIRHGDLALIGIDKLPTGLTASDSKVLMTGSGGNDHIVEGGTFYPKKNGQVIGYLVADEGCRLLHPDHGKKVGNAKLRTVNLPAGIYSLSGQVEQTHEALKPVVD